jgi:hypothetical protein
MFSLSKGVLIIGPANLAFCDSGAGAKESVAKRFWSLKASSNICDQSSANQWSTRSMSSGRHAPYEPRRPGDVMVYYPMLRPGGS